MCVFPRGVLVRLVEISPGWDSVWVAWSELRCRVKVNSVGWSVFGIVGGDEMKR